MSWIRQGLAIGLLAVGLSSPAAAGTDSLVASSGDTLRTIDPATGAGTPRCAVGAFGPLSEIESAPSGELYGATGQGTGRLIRIDPADCTEVGLEDHELHGSLDGLEFVGETLYGAFSEVHEELGDHGSAFVQVHVATGLFTFLAELPYHPVRGLAWDPATEILYGVGAPIGEQVGPVEGDHLFRIDLVTFATTEIGPTGLSLGALELGADGVLYGGSESHDHLASGVGEGAALYAIDRATGEATLLGHDEGAETTTGLAFVGGGTPIVAVPSLGTFGLVALAGALALVAGCRLAPRKRPHGRTSC